MRTEDRDLPCNEFVELVTDYLEDSLSGDVRSRFEAHLAACDGCSAYLGQMETTIRVTGNLTQETIPRHAMDALLAAFRDFSRT